MFRVFSYKCPARPVSEMPGGRGVFLSPEGVGGVFEPPQ